jgi:hypothetical protein
MALATQSAECITGSIDMVLGTTAGKPSTPVRLHDVLYVPGIQYNLISGTKLADRGVQAVFKRRELELYHNGKLLATGTRTAQNWLLNVQEVIQSPVTVLNTSTVEEEGAQSPGDDPEVAPRQISTAERQEAIIQATKTCTGIDIKGLAVSKKPCEACAVGKATQTIRRAMPTIPRATKVGELIHVDVGGGGKLTRGLHGESET